MPPYVALILCVQCDGMKRYVLQSWKLLCCHANSGFAYLESPRFSHFPSLEEGLTFARDFSNLADYSRTMKTVLV